MRLNFLLLLSFLCISRSLILVKNTSIVADLDNYRRCVPLPSTSNDIWLKTESVYDSFASQLLAIYSYIPTAIMMNATGIVMGDLYSRRPSYETNVYSQNNMISLPFSAFFDWHYFHYFWSHSPISSPFQLLLAKDYHACDRNRSVTTIKRIPEYSSLKKHEFHRLFLISKVKTPIAPNTTLAMSGNNKFKGLFWYWNEPNNWLLAMHQSLQPSNVLHKIYKGMLYMVSKDFIAIQLSMEISQYFEKMNTRNSTGIPNGNSNGNSNFNSSNFQEIKDKLISSLLTSSCVSSLISFDSSFIDAPTLYFMSTNSAMHSNPNTHTHTHTNSLSKLTKAQVTNHKYSQNRLKQVIVDLNNRGFYNVYTRGSLIDKIIKYLNENPSAQKEYGDPSIYRRIYPEQGQYLDSLLARRAICYVSSSTPTITSYMIQRMRKLDRGEIEELSSVNKTTYGDLYTFRQYGM